MCKYEAECTYCHGCVVDPRTCARYEAAEDIGMSNVPDHITPIDYTRAAMLELNN